MAGQLETARERTGWHFLTLLLPSFRKHPDAVIFHPYLGGDGDDKWGSVTYREFEQYLAVSRLHWAPLLLGLDRQDIVGFWLTGRKLSDLANALAISSLGYTPQFFGGFFDKATVVLDLLVKTGGKALVVDSSHHTECRAWGSAVPILAALEEEDMRRAISEASSSNKLDTLTLKGPFPEVNPDEYAVLFHSSGTTGGLPKIIPNTFKMLRAVILEKWPNSKVLRARGERMVLNTLGNLAHVGSFHSFLGAVYGGDSVIQTSGMSISPEEFVGMVRLHSLNVLSLYGTYLSALVRAAREDPAVKDALQHGVSQILYTGVSMNKEDEKWANENGISITVIYATTETAPLLATDPRSRDRLLRPIRGANPTFVPFTGDGDLVPTQGRVLYECTVPPTAPDCPPPALCAVDGSYHTNDLFESVGDGWVYRGRANDWIKMGESFVDTKNIEDNVRTTCSDLLHDAVVVGSRWNAPCMVVESAVRGLDLAGRRAVAQEIVKRTATLNERVFAHERIQDPTRILVVDQGTLPRTKGKGNVRRSATEDMVSHEFNEIFGGI